MDDTLWNGTKYFFKQSQFRGTPRRQRIHPDDIPPTFRHTKAKTTTNSSTRSGDEIPDIISDIPTQDNRSQTVEEIQETCLKDTLAGGDAGSGRVSSQSFISPSIPAYKEDRQRLVFENYKTFAFLTLSRLDELVIFFSTRIKRHPIRLPTILELSLLCEFKDLTRDAIYNFREWQTLSAREAWDNESSRKNHNFSYSYDESRSALDTSSVSGFGDNLSVMDRQLRPESGRSSTAASSRSKFPKSKTKVGLDNISENDEDRKSTRASKTASAVPSINVIGAQSKRTRLERFKPMIDPASRVALAERLRRERDDTSESDNKSARALYVPTIQFALSSDDCEEKGWIVYDENSCDLERQTVLEWARQRLNTSIKHKIEQKSKEREQGYDKDPEIVFYGDKDKTRSWPHKATHNINFPDITSLGILPQNEEDDNLLMMDVPVPPSPQVFSATTMDGSTSLFYPCGLMGIMSSHAGTGREGYYINVYDDSVARTMLANFTPSGRGACYHRNGVVRFLSTDKEVILSDEHGVCKKRWPWPPTQTGKLPATIQIQLNPYIVFRCLSRNQMTLSFTCGKHTHKLSMVHSLVQPEPDDNGKFKSGHLFFSQSAKDIAKASNRLKAGQQWKKKEKSTDWNGKVRHGR